MASFQKRLQACMRGGNLTVADLARWFDRPHSTVRTWAEMGSEPGGGPIDIQHAESLLTLLEVLIRKKQGFPLPRLSPRKRIEQLQQIRTAAMPS